MINIKSKKVFPLVLLFVLSALLGSVFITSSCAKKDTKTPDASMVASNISATPSPTATPGASSPTPVPTNSEFAVNPFTGLLTMDPANVGKRSVTVSINNLPAALPSRGLSKADAIYEFETEYGITRLLALYADASMIPEVGSIRSARIVACDLSAGTNSIFVHCGINCRVPDYLAFNDIDDIEGLDYLTGSKKSVDGEITLSNGIYFWRDSTWLSTRSSIEHTAVSNGTHIVRAIEALGLTYEGETPSLFNFTASPSPSLANGAACNTLVVYFSKNNDDSTFTYNAITKLYAKSEYGKTQMDETTGEQVAVTNVFTLFTNIESHGDSAGTIDVYFADGGTGYYASEGKIIEVLWTKNNPHDVISVTDLEGNPIQVNVGTSYINVVRETVSAKTSWS